MPTKAEQRRALYRHRLLHKMCTRCAQPPAENRRECRVCIEKRRALGPYYRDYRRKRRASLLAAGCCPQHHKRPVVAGMKGCLQCVEKGRRPQSKRQRRAGRPISPSAIRRGYRPSPTRKRPLEIPGEISQPRVLAVSEAVARVLRLMLSESRDLATADPAEIADRCTGEQPAFLSEVEALRNMYVLQWGRRRWRTERI